MTLGGHLKPAQRERLQGELLSIGTHGMLALCGIYFSFRFFAIEDCDGFSSARRSADADQRGGDNRRSSSERHTGV